MLFLNQVPGGVVGQAGDQRRLRQSVAVRNPAAGDAQRAGPHACHVKWPNVPSKPAPLWLGAWFPQWWAGEPEFAEGVMEVDWVRINSNIANFDYNDLAPWIGVRWRF